MPMRTILIDSNVLIHLTNPSSSEHALAGAALNILISSGAQILYTLQNLAEFWNVCTRTGFGGLGISIEETSMRLAKIEARFEFLFEPILAPVVFKELLTRYQVHGVQVHDARLAAVMLASDVREILTFDKKDFERFRELTVIHPSVLLG